MLTWNDILHRARHGNLAADRQLVFSEAQWREKLTPVQFAILRQSATERPFVSEMCALFEPGIYQCAGCDALLFDATNKFESHSGWPSFTQPIQNNAIAFHADESHGMVRVETRCAVCDGHLGHVFPDGPKPSGLRFCINAAALRKVND